MALELITNDVLRMAHGLGVNPQEVNRSAPLYSSHGGLGEDPEEAPPVTATWASKAWDEGAKKVLDDAFVSVFNTGSETVVIDVTLQELGLGSSGAGG